MAVEPQRLVFMGSAGFAVPALHALAKSRHPVVAVYSQPPRPAERGRHPRRTPVHEAAEALGLPCRTPGSLRDPSVQAAFRELRADLAIVAAYGLLLPEPTLGAPRLGCVNIHASLLPRWRGAAPIQRAIIAGDEETGVSFFQMERGLDTGPVYATARVPIGPEATAGEIHDALAELAAGMVVEVVEGIAGGRLSPEPQPERGVTYAAKLGPEDERIDWAEPAVAIERRLRALDPFPGCWTTLGGERVRVLAAEITEATGEPGIVLDDRLTVACGAGALRLTRLQRQGRRAMAAEELLRGFPVPAGTRLG